ncbi:MAG: DNA-directed RNA polymerase subunit omega [Chitinophagales bacterium]
MSSKRKKYNISPYVQPKDVENLEIEAGNLYEALNIISKRSRQISLSMKEELHSKLNEFASSTDTLEEIHENKEQIEISRFYERMPHATLLALEEFLGQQVYYRNPLREEKERKENRKSNK